MAPVFSTAYGPVQVGSEASHRNNSEAVLLGGQRLARAPALLARAAAPLLLVASLATWALARGGIGLGVAAAVTGLVSGSGVAAAVTGLVAIEQDESEPYLCAMNYGEGLGTWENVWTEQQREWCCQHKRLGCPTLPVFNCTAGLAFWRQGWSFIKKTWCCKHQALSFCDQSGGGNVSSLEFDCDAGLDFWQQLWSTQKKEYCCTNSGKGCPEQRVCGRSKDALGPNLFCVAVIRPQGYEPELMKEQLKKCVHIFACDEWTVVSDSSLWLSKELRVKTLPFSGPKLSTVAGASYNAEQFRSLWRRIHDEGQYKNADWIVKTDPDAVFFAERLRANLGKSAFVTTKPLFFANCQEEATVSPHFGGPFMYGALELFSRSAADIFFNMTASSSSTCEAKGYEEHYITKCMEAHDISLNHDMNLKLLRDDHVKCNGAAEASPCSGDEVTFHPYSGVKEWFDCYDTAMASNPPA